MCCTAEALAVARTDRWVLGRWMGWILDGWAAGWVAWWVHCQHRAWKVRATGISTTSHMVSTNKCRMVGRLTPGQVVAKSSHSAAHARVKLHSSSFQLDSSAAWQTQFMYAQKICKLGPPSMGQNANELTLQPKFYAAPREKSRSHRTPTDVENGGCKQRVVAIRHQQVLL